MTPASWERFFRDMIERGLKGVRLVAGDRCAGLVSTVNSMLARGEVPAVHGALHAQRALQDAAQPPRMGVGGPLPEYHSILLILQQEISIEDCKKIGDHAICDSQSFFVFLGNINRHISAIYGDNPRIIDD